MRVALTENEQRVLLKRYEKTMTKEEAIEKLQILSAEVKQNHIREDNRIHSTDFKEHFQELLGR